MTVIDGMVDFHVHSAPSLAPRHSHDPHTLEDARAAGVAKFVLKAHEGSSAERARLLGAEVVGGVVLNSPVGGANPDAVAVAAALGARVVWLPTISSPAHIAASHNPELSAHRGISFREVPVVEDGAVRPEWLDVIDEAARAGMVLASGHLTMDEAVVALDTARRRGVHRLLVNHPGLPFLGWRDEHRAQFRALGAHLEIGVLADHPGRRGRAHHPRTWWPSYPHELLVFGSDLGHTGLPAHRGPASGTGSSVSTRSWAIRGLELVARTTARGTSWHDAPP